MKNELWPSIILGIIITVAIVMGPGLALAGYVAHSVTPVNADLEVDRWQAAFMSSLGWSAAVGALATAIWLLKAHKGVGMDSKTGTWYALGAGAIFVAALIAWFMPPAVKEGPGRQVGISVLLVLLGYWISTLFMTPNQYHHTPFLGKLLWGHKG